MVNDINLGQKRVTEFLSKKIPDQYIDWGFKASDGFIYHYTDGTKQTPGEDNSVDPYIKVLLNGTIFFTSPTRDKEAFNAVRPERLVRFKK